MCQTEVSTIWHCNVHWADVILIRYAIGSYRHIIILGKWRRRTNWSVVNLKIIPIVKCSKTIFCNSVDKKWNHKSQRNEKSQQLSFGNYESIFLNKKALVGTTYYWMPVTRFSLPHDQKWTPRGTLPLFEKPRCRIILHCFIEKPGRNPRGDNSIWPDCKTFN